MRRALVVEAARRRGRHHEACFFEPRWRAKYSCSPGRVGWRAAASRRRPTASGSRVRSRRLMCASRRRWRGASSICRSPKAIASTPARSSPGSTRPTRRWRSLAPAPSASRLTRSSGCCAPAPGPRISARPTRSWPRRESDGAVALAEVAAAQPDVDRFESLLASNSGSRKQRDDAVARRDVARERARADEKPGRRRERSARPSEGRFEARRDCGRRRPRRRRRRADSGSRKGDRRRDGTCPDRRHRHRRRGRGRGAGRAASGPGDPDRPRPRVGERIRGRAGGAAHPRRTGRDPLHGRRRRRHRRHG